MSCAAPPDEPSDEVPVERLLVEARQGGNEPLGRLLQVYRNHLTVLATTQINPRLRRRMAPSDLVQETMLAAHRDFEKFRGATEREFLGWLRQILINSLHHAIEVHLKAKKRDLRCEVSIEQVSAALDKSVLNFANVLADRGPSPSAPSWWYGESHRTRDSFWLEFSADVESQLATGAGEQLAEEADATATQTQIADADSQVDSEEGGMIEVIAASQPGVEHALARSNGEWKAPRPEPDKVRMDTGVGLFQVFEIATSPHDSGLEADPAPGDAEPIRAASLSALLIAASLCFDRDQRCHDQRRKEKLW